MNETPDFSARVEIADKIIDVAKRVVRSLRSTPSPDWETSLAAEMVLLRDLLVHVRYDIERDSGPRITIEGMQSIDAYAFFEQGSMKLARTYSQLQRRRYDDIEWFDAETERSDMISGIKILLDFQAVAYACENGLAWPIAKQQLQLMRDRRRIKSPEIGDNRQPIGEDSEKPKGVTAADLAERYKAPKRSIRELLLKEGLKPKNNGGRGRNYLFDEKEAVAICARNYSLKG